MSLDAYGALAFSAREFYQDDRGTLTPAARRYYQDLATGKPMVSAAGGFTFEDIAYMLAVTQDVVRRLQPQPVVQDDASPEREG